MFFKDKKVIVTGGSGFVGSHIVEELLKQGAKLVEHAQDVVDELPHDIRAAAPRPPSVAAENKPPLSPEELVVFKALEPYPIHIDALMRKTALNPGKLSSILLGLELKGFVQQLPGKLFSICEGKN